RRARGAVRGRAWARLGGQVTRALPIVAGFAATVPGAVVGELARLPGVRAGTPDGRVRLRAAARPPRADRARQAPVAHRACSDRYGPGPFIAGLVAGNAPSWAASGRASP